MILIDRISKRIIEKIQFLMIALILLLYTSCSEVHNEKNSSLTSINQDSISFITKINKELNYFHKNFLVSKPSSHSIKLNYNNIGDYQIVCNYSDVDKNILLGYNKINHSLEFIDLDNNLLYNTIELDTDGEKGIRQVVGLYCHNVDSIFIVSDFKISLINSKGDFSFTYKINRNNSELKGLDFSSYSIAPSRNKPIYFFAPQNKLIVPTNYSTYDQWSIPEHYQAPIYAEILLAEKKINQLPIFYPEEFLELV